MATRTPFDVFLVLRPFREIVSELKIILRPLCRLDPRVLGRVEAFYCETADCALLNLGFSSSLDRATRRELASAIRNLGLTAIIPSELGAEERRRFYLEHLAEYDTYLQQYRSSAATSIIDCILDTLFEHACLPPAVTAELASDGELFTELTRPAPLDERPTATWKPRRPASEWTLV